MNTAFGFSRRMRSPVRRCAQLVVPELVQATSPAAATVTALLSPGVAVGVGGTGVAARVAVAEGTGEIVGVAVGLGVGVDVGMEVLVGTGESVGIGVGDGSDVSVGRAVSDGTGVPVCVASGVSVGAKVGSTVGVAVSGIGVGIGKSSAMTVSTRTGGTVPVRDQASMLSEEVGTSTREYTPSPVMSGVTSNETREFAFTGPTS
jgi:hypothetical protein